MLTEIAKADQAMIGIYLLMLPFMQVKLPKDSFKILFRCLSTYFLIYCKTTEKK